MTLVGRLPEGVVEVHSRHVGAFVGNEHEHVVEGVAVEIVLVALSPQLGHMLLHRRHMRRSVGLALLVGFGVEHVDVVLYRHLGVDNDVSAFGVVYHHVGA